MNTTGTSKPKNTADHDITITTPPPKKNQFTLISLNDCQFQFFLQIFCSSNLHLHNGSYETWHDIYNVLDFLCGYRYVHEFVEKKCRKVIKIFVIKRKGQNIFDYFIKYFFNLFRTFEIFLLKILFFLRQRMDYKLVQQILASFLH